MRTFNEREKRIIQQLLDVGNNHAIPVQAFIKSFAFTAESGRALILQTQAHYAVFFLIPEHFDDEIKRNEEIKLFFELIALLHELHTTGYLLIYRTKIENFYFFQETFSNEKIEDHSIVLNTKGDYTASPDCIHCKNKNIIYKGIFFHADAFELILTTTTGNLLIHEQLHTLLKDKIKKAPTHIAAINLWISTVGFFIMGLLFCLLYFKTSAHMEQLKPSPKIDTLISQQVKISDSTTQQTVQSSNTVVALPTAFYGVDISKWNGNAAKEIDPRDSISFIICKATEGTTLVDPDFDSNWDIIKRKKCILGVYHFYHIDDNPLEQAEHFISTVQTKGKTDMVPIVDIEQGSLPVSISTDPVALQKNFLLFLNAVEKNCDCVPMIYTNAGFANYYLLDSTFARYPLWLAAYTDAAPPLPVTWKKKGYKIWQKKNSYQVGTYMFDFDVFYGKKKDLYQ